MQVGYNLQSGNFVLGIEGDFAGAGVWGSHNFSGEYVSPSGGGGFDDYLSGRLHLKNDWQASARLRAGIAMDRWLVYATGGVAFADIKLHANGAYVSYGSLATGTFNMSAHQSPVGWTIGLGTEYAFTNNWIGRIEVRYTDFGSDTYNLNYRGDMIPVRAKVSEATGLVGLSYKF